MRKMTPLLVLLSAAWLQWQDPKPAKPATKQDPDPTKQAPATKSAKPKRPIPGKPKRHPLEGVYKLRSRVIEGVPGNGQNKGYLVITGRHLFLSLASPGTDDNHPLVHSAVREWRQTADGIQMTAKLDYFSDNNGAITMTPDGKQETRHIQPIRGGLRVTQGQHSYLEFERLE